MFGFYQIIQSLCLIYLKPKEDPLVGISQMEYLQIVQVFQRQNAQFIKNIKKKEQFIELPIESKQQFLEAIDEEILSSRGSSFGSLRSSNFASQVQQNLDGREIILK